MYYFLRNIVYLIVEYLKETGLQKSHSTLIDEAQLSSDFTVCDNVDLETIYLEFCSYFQIKFGKKPRFVKKNDQVVTTVSSSSSLQSVDGRQALSKKRATLKTAPHVSTILPDVSVIASSQFLRVSSLSPPTHDDASEKLSPIFAKPMTNEEFFNNHPFDWKEMTEIIFKDVVKKDLCVKWDDIKGQDGAKMILQESVIFPMKYPQLFNRVQPWKGLHNKSLQNNLSIIDIYLVFPSAAVLLHGVPGCGKTLLARALCSETRECFTFFNITASTLISKWRGESEKLVRVLFELAKFHAPSIICKFCLFNSIQHKSI